MEVFTDNHINQESDTSPGKLVIICGQSGSGKTTLVREALARVRGIEYLRTYTTRVRRVETEDENSFEYNFVTREHYLNLRNSFPNWDHSEIYGEWYGTNIEAANSRLRNGMHLVVNSIPTVEAVEDLRLKYGNNIRVVVLEVANKIVEERLIRERQKHEQERIVIDGRANFEELKKRADSIFIPIMNITEDSIRFRHLIEKIITV